MLRNFSEDDLSTDREYIVQLLEASLVCRNETADSHTGDF